MKASATTFTFPRPPRKKWPLERKLTITAILMVLAGFVTFGEVLGKISQLNTYMVNTNDMREQVAGLKATTTSLVSDVEDMKQSLNRIETYMLKSAK